MKKSIVLISAGLLNLLHASFHIIQFVQSILIVAYSSEKHEHHDGWIDFVFHSPYFTVLWGVVGILTLTIGIKDYLHHKRCKNRKHSEN